MQRLSGFLLLTAIACLTACKGHEKKVLVYASGTIKVDDTKQHITISDGTTHHEQELDFTSGDPVNLEVESPQGKNTLSVTEDGLYIANLKPDTVLGSMQHVGAEGGEARITQDALKQKLDSLQKLTTGLNVSEANKNYLVAPGKVAKISGNAKGKVFGPFTSIPSSFDAGSVPEIYKFYSMKEIREIIGNLERMSSTPTPAK
ncbi:MAG: hypothetical protein JST68_05460 [Bacteroidetes bacterium]|nr:hypothetical protein [Bacteroidota bacterium]